MCVHVCVVLEKTSIHKVVKQMPSLPPLLSALRQCTLLAALRRTAAHSGNVHGATRQPLDFEFFQPKWDKSGISQIPSILVADDAGNKFPKKAYPGKR